MEFLTNLRSLLMNFLLWLYLLLMLSNCYQIQKQLIFPIIKAKAHDSLSALAFLLLEVKKDFRTRYQSLSPLNSFVHTSFTKQKENPKKLSQPPKHFSTPPDIRNSKRRDSVRPALLSDYVKN